MCLRTHFYWNLPVGFFSPLLSPMAAGGKTASLTQGRGRGAPLFPKACRIPWTWLIRLKTTVRRVCVSKGLLVHSRTPLWMQRGSRMSKLRRCHLPDPTTYTERVISITGNRFLSSRKFLPTRPFRVLSDHVRSSWSSVDEQPLQW